jgi:mRNA-degrading endonuclease toxin of MazEF toxin-antitoxin module
VVVPLTGNISRIYPGETVVTVNGNKSKAMTDQIMSADKSRYDICVLHKNCYRFFGGVGGFFVFKEGI